MLRKLNWFVDERLVEGWFDPRFPTVQGCVRRGMNIEALKRFILSQGASKRVITMEWDKFWSDNKKVWEEVAPRYMGITRAHAVLFTVTNLPQGDAVERAQVPLHPQKAEMGQRVVLRCSRLWLEQEDAAAFAVGEEVTLLRWGNFIIDEIVRDESSGIVSAITGHFNPEATNFSKTKKVTWLAATVSNEHRADADVDDAD